MTGVTTGQTALTTATDSDDTEVYLTTGLVAALQALANLFESATGHDHSGSGKGKPIITAGLASGVTLTSPHMTSPVVDSGGLTVTAGGLTITAGTATLVDLIVANGVANPASSGANNAIRLPNNQRLAFRNAANSGDDYLSFDTSDRLVIQGIAAAATATNGGGEAVKANVQEYITVVYQGNVRKLPLFAN